MSQVVIRVSSVMLVVAGLGIPRVGAQELALEESAAVETSSARVASPDDSTSLEGGSAATTSAQPSAPAPAPTPAHTTSAPSPHGTSDVSSTPPLERDPEVPVHEEDDGRKADFIWLEVEGGISYVDLIALEQDEFAGTSGMMNGFAETSGVGPTIGVGLGFRVFFLALGARATLASYPGFEVGTVGGEVQFRLPVPVVEPWIRVGAGYAWQGNANYADPAMSSSTVYGWTINGALGLDIFLAWWFSLGIGVSVDFLNMTRQADPRQSCMGVTEFCPARPGDAVGAQGRAFLQAGLHF